MDGPALVEKFTALSYCEKLAIVDAAERWWNRVVRGEQSAVGEMLDYPRYIWQNGEEPRCRGVTSGA